MGGVGLVSKVLGKGNIGSKIGTAMAIGFTVTSYTGARKEGKGVGSAAGEAASIAVIGSLIPNPIVQMGYFMGTAAYDMVLQTQKAKGDEVKRNKYIGSGTVGSYTGFNMSNAGYTMRQRSVAKMRETGQNINSVLSNEARNYIQSSKRNRDM